MFKQYGKNLTKTLGEKYMKYFCCFNVTHKLYDR